MADPTSAVNINMGTLVGSYASVARMLDEVASVPGAEGVLLTFDDFLSGIETFGERIQPLMQCRAHLPALTPGGGMMTTLTARPEASTFDPQQSALIVVDMQTTLMPRQAATRISPGLMSQPLARSLPAFKPP